MVAEVRRITTVCDCHGKSPDEIQADPISIYVGRFHYIRSGRFAGQQWRPKGYGNPFRPDVEIENRLLAMTDCINRFEAYLARQMQTEPARMVPAMRNLIGKRLWCWCCTWDGVSLPRPLCHAAVYADWTNRMLRGEKPWEQVLLKAGATQ